MQAVPRVASPNIVYAALLDVNFRYYTIINHPEVVKRQEYNDVMTLEDMLDELIRENDKVLVIVCGGVNTQIKTLPNKT